MPVFMYEGAPHGFDNGTAPSAITPPPTSSRANARSNSWRSSWDKAQPYCALMPASLITGHQLRDLGLVVAANASGVCISRGGSSCPIAVRRFAHHRIGQSPRRGGVQFRDDVLRRTLRHPERVPEWTYMPGMPASSTVGRSGAAVSLVLAVTA